MRIKDIFKNLSRKNKTEEDSKTSIGKTLTDSRLNTMSSTQLEIDDTEFQNESISKKIKAPKRPFASISKRLNADKDLLTDENSESFQEDLSRENDFLHDRESVDPDDNEITTDSSTEISDDYIRKTYSRTHTDLITESYALQKKLPIVGRLPIKQQYQLSGLLAIISIIMIVSGIVVYGDAADRKNTIIQLATEVNSDIQKTNTLFTDATLGRENSLNSLLTLNNKTQSDYSELKKYNFMLENNHLFIPFQDNIDKDLSILNQNIEKINSESALINNSNGKVNQFNNEVEQLNNKIDNFITIYNRDLSNQNELFNVYALKTYLQAMNASLTNILLVDNIDVKKIEVLNGLRQAFKNNLVIINTGDAAKYIKAMNVENVELVKAYNDVANSWIKMSSQIDGFINKSGELIGIRNLSAANNAVITNLIVNMDALLNTYQNSDVVGFWKAQTLLSIGIILFILTLVVTFYIYSYEKDNRSLFEKLENNNNQTSIIKLLHELAPLQDGDLTKKTTVTEEITGAIADSINATIDSLASLVRKIKETSSKMRNKTTEVSKISVDMLNISEDQARDLNSTGASVIEVAEAIKEISDKTNSASSEALKSVNVSEEGANQVKASLETMQEIKNHMNKTINLMQKVANSSQQISEVVELLSDMTEETSILALNATVQAAKAGEAGRPFKIVADSLQELADKASEATRRVGALINTVQTDVHAVEDSIEKTNEQVDNGVELSQSAGNSLNKMMIASNELSELILATSEEARDHALNARKISESMKKILKNTENSKVYTEKTVASIAEISQISNELGNSVQTFKID